MQVLGTDLAIEFLLRFGGAEIYIPSSPGSRSRVVDLLGEEKTRALAAMDYLLQRRVPLANDWIIACLHAKGVPAAEIARRTRCSDVSVRKCVARIRERGNPR